jgi:hypothetical protein
MKNDPGAIRYLFWVGKITLEENSKKEGNDTEQGHEAALQTRRSCPHVFTYRCVRSRVNKI